MDNFGLNFRNAEKRFFFFLVAILAFLYLTNRSHTEDGAHTSTLSNVSDSTAWRYLWPTNASRSLASSFAETRSNHFHFGVDIRTQQRTGFPCYAVADGYVARLKVSPYGYGRVLYLQLNDGNQAVYAHLLRFAPQVEKVVRAEQMRRKTFRCELFLKPEDLPFEMGDTVAYTGASGVGSPHLHFEMRDAQGYRNPLLLGFTVEDTIPPTPQKIAVCPLHIDSEINSDFRTVILRLAAKEAGCYDVSQIPAVYGPVGLEIAGFDQADGSGNVLSFYGLDLFLDGEHFFSTRYDHFGYYEEKQIDLDRDYRLRKLTGDAFHHLWKDPSATVDFYHLSDGVIDTRKFAPGLHDYEIVLSDFTGNVARVKGRLHFSDEPLYPHVEGYSSIFGFFNRGQDITLQNNHAHSSNPGVKAEFFEDFVLFSLPTVGAAFDVNLSLLEPYERQIPLIRLGGRWIGKLPLQPFPSRLWTVALQSKPAGGKTTADTAAWYIQPVKTGGGRVVSDDGCFQAHFDKDAVYRTLYARVSVKNPPAEGNFCGRIYHLEPDDMPIKGSVSVSIAIPPGEAQPEKLGVYGLSPKGVWKFLDNDRQKVSGFITGSSPRLEHYSLRRDLNPPHVGWLSPPLATSQRKPTFRLSVRDELSGFDDRTIDLEVDGQFVLMEYDPEAGTIFGSPEQEISPGEHQVVLSLRDFCGNETRLQKTVSITR